MPRKFACTLLSLLICLSTVFLAAAAPADGTDGAEPGQVFVPLSADISYDIAGAQFKISYTEGLVFISYEQSPDVKEGALTPVVEKDGLTILGFFSGANIFKPKNGTLDMGHLVFEFTGEGEQTVTIAEIKLVELIDNETTSDEYLGPITVTLTPEGVKEIIQESPRPQNRPQTSSSQDGAATTTSSANNSGGDIAVNPGADDSESGKSTGIWWIIVVAVVVVVAAAILIPLAAKKKKSDSANDKKDSDTSSDTNSDAGDDEDSDDNDSDDNIDND